MGYELLEGLCAFVVVGVELLVVFVFLDAVGLYYVRHGGGEHGAHRSGHISPGGASRKSSVVSLGEHY